MDGQEVMAGPLDTDVYLSSPLILDITFYACKNRGNFSTHKWDI